MPGDYVVLWNRRPMNQQNLLVSMTMNQDFLGKHCTATRFISLCCIDERDTWTGKVAKGKRTNAPYKQHQITWKTSFKISVCNENYPWWFCPFKQLLNVKCTGGVSCLRIDKAISAIYYSEDIWLSTNIVFVFQMLKTLNKRTLCFTSQ